MRDPMYLILKSLNMLIVRLTKIIYFVFSNFFPSPTPEEPENIGFSTFEK